MSSTSRSTRSASSPHTRSTARRRRGAERDVFRRTGTHVHPRPLDPSRPGEGRARERDQARRRDRREAAEGLTVAGDDRGARGLRPSGRDLRRLVGGRAAPHRARLRERPARRAHRVPARDRCRGRSDRRALLDRGRVAHPVPQHARHARAAPGDRREPRGGRPPHRPRAETNRDPRRHRRLRADRDGPADAEHLHGRPRRPQRARVDLRRGHGPRVGHDHRARQDLGGA